MVKDKPILFNTEMVRAIMDDIKSKNLSVTHVINRVNNFDGGLQKQA